MGGVPVEATRTPLRCHLHLIARKPSFLPYPELLSTLGDHLRKRRLDLGLLQSEVAEQLGVSEMTICNWETSRTSPQLCLIPRVIAFLGYNPLQAQSGSLGERLVAYRSARGFSQKALAKRLGVDTATLARWEREEGQPSRRNRGMLESLSCRGSGDVQEGGR